MIQKPYYSRLINNETLTLLYHTPSLAIGQGDIQKTPYGYSQLPHIAQALGLPALRFFLFEIIS